MAVPPVVRKVHQEYGVLLHDPHQQYQADHAVDVQRLTSDVKGYEGSRHAERQGQQH